MKIVKKFEKNFHDGMGLDPNPFFSWIRIIQPIGTNRIRSISERIRNPVRRMRESKGRVAFDACVYFYDVSFQSIVLEKTTNRPSDKELCIASKKQGCSCS